jgi:NADH dehydrogenase (ubiquinone) Fe-S protein 1
MVNIYINNKKKVVINNITILEACQNAGIELPRFCYHEQLSISGNCRMCLVELENSPKPIASCAVTVTNNMKIFTNTILVRKAREGVIEFLLANHPLDCPICDQGGECDLQDQSLIFGGDRGRYFEYKRSVEDKDCGFLIKTLMTRCIHCTRCVRFLEEFTGIKNFGTLGRGSLTEIGTYVNNILKSEVSGNLIDLCPVGALTSKPYSFKTRS